MERYEAALKEIDSHLDVRMPVNPDDLVEVRRKYSRGSSLPVERPLKPATPSQSISRAGEYVMKQARKGFVNISKDLSSPTEIYNTHFVPLKFHEAEREIDLPTEPSYLSEDFQKFWQSTDIVTRTVEELQALPFQDSRDHDECERRYREMIAKVVRKMKQCGLLDERRKTRQQLARIMQSFMATAKRKRLKLIRSYLTEKRLSWENLNESQQREFPEFAPPPPPEPTPEPEQPRRQEISREVNTRVIKQVMATARGLPSVYKVQGLTEEENTSSQRKLGFQRGLAAAERAMRSAVDRPPRPLFGDDTAPKTERILKAGDDAWRRQRGIVLTSMTARRPPTVIFRRPAKVIEPKLSTHDQYARFWAESDPLKRERQGIFFNPLDQLADVAKGFRGVDTKPIEVRDEDVEMPFTLESSRKSEEKKEETEPVSVVVAEEEDISDRVFSTSVCKTRVVEENLIEEPKPVPLYGGYDGGRAESDDVKFLAERTEDLKGREGEEAHRRLEKIWAQLGFSIQQKLDMAIKYSSTIEQSGRLAEALNLWDAAFTASEAYEKAYTRAKDFLRIEAPTSNHVDVTYGVLLVALKEAEDSLIQIEARLKQQLGDEFVVRRRRIQDLMEQRRMKLKIMSKELGLSS